MISLMINNKHNIDIDNINIITHVNKHFMYINNNHHNNNNNTYWNIQQCHNNNHNEYTTIFNKTIKITIMWLILIMTNNNNNTLNIV